MITQPIEHFMFMLDSCQSQREETRMTLKYGRFVVALVGATASVAESIWQSLRIEANQGA
jgi:hypothetical protein